MGLVYTQHTHYGRTLIQYTDLRLDNIEINFLRSLLFVHPVNLGDGYMITIATAPFDKHFF